jgi:acyl-CoA synthetase (AMP-forming)/AMP-acid ligase II
MVTATSREQIHRTIAVDAQALQRGRFRATPPDTPAGQQLLLVGSGRPVGMQVQVVDPDTTEVVPDGRIGEIWIRGESLASGYWARPGLTAATFQARTADGGGPYLRTGDLGAWWERDLYITGRLKEIIIVHGRNIYPYEAERVMGGLHRAFEGLAGCMFSVPGPDEQPVVVQELRPAGLEAADLRDIVRMIRESLTEALGVAVTNVVLVPPGTVLRTTSGKIQRLTMRDLFVAGRLRIVHQDLTPAMQSRLHLRPTVPVTAGAPADVLSGPR